MHGLVVWLYGGGSETKRSREESSVRERENSKTNENLAIRSDQARTSVRRGGRSSQSVGCVTVVERMDADATLS